MATGTQTEPTTQGAKELSQLAQRHLWMHFTRMGAYDETHQIPIITRGEGCYVWDANGKKYLDGSPRCSA